VCSAIIAERQTAKHADVPPAQAWRIEPGRCADA
jgi:hypothetical protein